MKYRLLLKSLAKATARVLGITIAFILGVYLVTAALMNVAEVVGTLFGLGAIASYFVAMGVFVVIIFIAAHTYQLYVQ